MSPKRNEVKFDYSPRPCQTKLHKMVGHRSLLGSDFDKRRFMALVAHRRLGKTMFGVNQCIMDAVANSSKGREHAPPRYALIYPERKQGKKNAWDYLKHFGSNIAGFTKNETDLYIEFKRNNARIYIEGADKKDRIRGEYFDGVFIDEYADVAPGLWTSVVYPALSDWNGWGIISGTPRGENHFYDAFKEKSGNDSWYTVVMPASEKLAKEFRLDGENEPDLIDSTNVFADEELDEIKEEMENDSEIANAEAVFNQEYGCKFKSNIIGSYYGKYMNRARTDSPQRITSVPYEKQKPVHTAWDLGIGDQMAIWFAQLVGKEIRFIDYYENSDMGLTEYFDICRQKPYSYQTHLAPFDIETRELTSGRSRKAIARDHGFNFTTVEKHSVEDRIAAVRSILSRCWFDRNKCRKGIKALEEYQKEYDEDKKRYKDKPKHNWASHGADAFGYFALGMDRIEHYNSMKDADTMNARSDFDVFS